MASQQDYRTRIILIFFVLTILVLIFKLFQIQIWDSSFKTRAEATAIQQRTLYPSRGLIYDRNYKLMVYNEPVYDVYMTYNLIDIQQDTSKFCKLLDINNSSYNQAMNVNWKSNQYSKNLPLVFLKKSNSSQISRTSE